MVVVRLLLCLNANCTVLFFRRKDGKVECPRCGEPGEHAQWPVRKL